MTNPHTESISQVAHEWRQRVQNGGLSVAEQQALTSWLENDLRHEEAFDRAQTVWSALDHLVAADIDPDLLPPQVASATVSQPSSTQTVFARIPMSLAAVVVLAAIGIASVFALSVGQDDSGATVSTLAYHQTGVGQQQTLTLDDGTVATLGAATRIDTTMSLKARVVELAGGAAYFDVAEDPSRPFTVKSGDLTATALGTEFAVRSNGGVFRVAVAEGSVEVAYPFLIDTASSGLLSREILGQGQEIAATLEAGLQPVRTIPTADVGAWRSNKLIYDGGTLRELVADANRYSSRTIVLTDSAEKFADQTITASFATDNIERMLAMLALSYPIEIDDSDADLLQLRARQESVD
ncbi:MAG: FecR domain-containing protein [Pseudomonadota bacterium]